MALTDCPKCWMAEEHCNCNLHAKFYSKEEVDKLTSEAYNQGYEDGKVYFYGMTSKDEERAKQIAKHYE